MRERLTPIEARKTPPSPKPEKPQVEPYVPKQQPIPMQKDEQYRLRRNMRRITDPGKR